MATNNVRVEEFEKDINVSDRVLQSIINIFAEKYYILSIEEGTYADYKELSKNDGSVGLVRNKEEYFAQVTNTVSREYKDHLMDFLDCTTLNQRIGNEKFISTKYQNKEGKWLKGLWIPTDRNPSGEVTHAVYAVLDIDQEERKEREYKKKIETMADTIKHNTHMVSGLSARYAIAYYLNFSDNHYKVIGLFDMLQGQVKEEGRLDTEFEGDFMRLVSPDSYAEVQAMVDINTIQDRLVNNDYLSADYIDGIFGWWHRAELIVTSRNDDGTAGGAVFTVCNIQEQKYFEQSMNELYKQVAEERNNGNEMTEKAEHDPLTGIYNRAGFENLVRNLETKAPVGFALIDVDKFKGINDTYGHDIGDKILVKVANLLEKTFRNTDHVVRFGGDEFVVLMMDVNIGNGEFAKNKVENMNKILTNPEDGLPPTSLSVGIAFSQQGYHEELYNMADEALYIVKENGRCGCSIYEPK